MPLTPEQKATLERLYIDVVRFYHAKAREIIIASERADHAQRISATALVELRSAFEHLMRSHGVVYGMVPQEVTRETGFNEFEYCTKNINKAYAHLCRAAHDAYDVIAISLALEIEKYDKSISSKALYAVIPDAAATVVVPFQRGKDSIDRAKLKKDVISREAEERQFVEYETATKDMLSARNTLRTHMPALIRYDQEIEREKAEIAKLKETLARQEVDGKKSKRLGQWGLVAGIIGVLATLFTTIYVLNSTTKSTIAQEEKIIKDK